MEMERVTYVVAYKSGKSIMLRLDAKTINMLHINDRDELKLVITKTGRSIPVTRITPFSRQYRKELEEASADADEFGNPKEVVEESNKEKDESQELFE